MAGDARHRQRWGVAGPGNAPTGDDRVISTPDGAAPRVRRTATRLADGRELFSFDASEPYVSGGATRSMIDSRVPGAAPSSGSMRYDLLTGEWVALAEHRMDRTHLPAPDRCPLCPARLGREPGEVPAEDYEVVVFENRFPSFHGPPDGGTTIDGEGLWPARSAHGRCEVVCFTSDHDATFADLEPGQVRTVVEAWADRTAELSALAASHRSWRRPGRCRDRAHQGGRRRIAARASTSPRPTGRSDGSRPASAAR